MEMFAFTNSCIFSAWMKISEKKLGSKINISQILNTTFTVEKKITGFVTSVLVFLQLGQCHFQDWREDFFYRLSLQARISPQTPFMFDSNECC